MRNINENATIVLGQKREGGREEEEREGRREVEEKWSFIGWL